MVVGGLPRTLAHLLRSRAVPNSKFQSRKTIGRRIDAVDGRQRRRSTVDGRRTVDDRRSSSLDGAGVDDRQIDRSTGLLPPIALSITTSSFPCFAVLPVSWLLSFLSHQ
jgi:hypothetical protein